MLLFVSSRNYSRIPRLCVRHFPPLDSYCCRRVFSISISVVHRCVYVSLCVCMR